MLSGLCAAGGVNAADIIVLVILAVGVIAGIASGFARMLRGFLGTIVSIVVAVVCAIFLSEKLAGASLGSLTTTIESKLGGLGSFMTVPSFVEDGVIKIASDSGTVAVADQIGGFGGKVFGALQGILITLCGKNLNGSNSVGFAIGDFASVICAGAIIVIGGIIILEIIFSLLSKGFSALVAKQKPLRTVNRLLGMVLSAAVAVLVVFAIMLIVYKFGDKLGGFTDMISSSTVAKWFYENNPFAGLI